MTNDITTQTNGALQTYAFSNAQAFEAAQRMATALSKSKLVPKEYQDNLPNAIVALEVAQRIGASPLMVMQNLYVVHGRPSWSSQFVVAAINSSGRFKPLRFDITREENEREFEYEVFETEWVNREKITKTVKKKTRIKNATCIAWSEDDTGQRLESPPVSIEMACLEGWYDKSGSKWRTMPELMLRYRSAAFFGRLYAPEILMGMKTQDEAEEMIDITPKEESPILGNINEAIKAEMAKPAVTTEHVATEPEQQVITIQDAVEDIGSIPTLEGLEFKFNSLSPLFKDTPEAFALLVNARDQRKTALSPRTMFKKATTNNESI